MWQSLCNLKMMIRNAGDDEFGNLLSAPPIRNDPLQPAIKFSNTFGDGMLPLSYPFWAQASCENNGSSSKLDLCNWNDSLSNTSSSLQLQHYLGVVNGAKNHYHGFELVSPYGREAFDCDSLCVSSSPPALVACPCQEIDSFGNELQEINRRNPVIPYPISPFCSGEDDEPAVLTRISCHREDVKQASSFYPTIIQAETAEELPSALGMSHDPHLVRTSSNSFLQATPISVTDYDDTESSELAPAVLMASRQSDVTSHPDNSYVNDSSIPSCGSGQEHQRVDSLLNLSIECLSSLFLQTDANNSDPSSFLCISAEDNTQQPCSGELETFTCDSDQYNDWMTWDGQEEATALLGQRKDIDLIELVSQEIDMKLQLEKVKNCTTTGQEIGSYICTVPHFNTDDQVIKEVQSNQLEIPLDEEKLRKICLEMRTQWQLGCISLAQK